MFDKRIFLNYRINHSSFYVMHDTTDSQLYKDNLHSCKRNTYHLIKDYFIYYFIN